jgi:hypothetical protein
VFDAVRERGWHDFYSRITTSLFLYFILKVLKKIILFLFFIFLDYFNILLLKIFFLFSYRLGFVGA